MSSVLPQIPYIDASPAVGSFRAEILKGLSRRPKAVSPKHLYDDRGSRLFDAICELPEYYPTRTETGILQRHAREIADRIGHGCVLVEPGAGSCRKVEHLLEPLRPAAYVPADISGDHLRCAALRLLQEHPWLEVLAASADFTQLPVLDPMVPPGRRVVFFPGSTIGNFEPEQARRFLQDVAAFVAPDGGLLVGVDLKKDERLLHAAYNDQAGVTARFNLNLLRRINAELDGEFHEERFEHKAFYNDAVGRVEMHIVSRAAQLVRVAGRPVAFVAGESIHTENSYKYTLTGFRELCESAGLSVKAVWTDEQAMFSVHYLTADTGIAGGALTG